MDRSAALAYIMSADNDGLNDIIDAVKFRREKLARINRYSLAVGTAVKFSHKGVEYRGTINKIRVKKAVVNCISPTNVTYTVPLNMLESA